MCRSNSSSGVPPRKIRRSLTFNGAENVSSLNISQVLHPPTDDVFSQPEPIIPSFLEEGRDMIRRITVDTVSN